MLKFNVGCAQCELFAPLSPMTPRDTKIIRFCNFLLRIGATGQTRFGAGITHPNGSAVTHFPKCRQCGVSTAYTRFLRCEQISALGALEGCSISFCLGSHAVMKTPVVQLCTCNSALVAPQTCAFELVKHTLEVRKTCPSDGLFRHFGPKTSKPGKKTFSAQHLLAHLPSNRLNRFDPRLARFGVLLRDNYFQAAYMQDRHPHVYPVGPEGIIFQVAGAARHVARR